MIVLNLQLAVVVVATLLETLVETLVEILVELVTPVAQVLPVLELVTMLGELATPVAVEPVAVLLLPPHPPQSRDLAPLPPKPVTELGPGLEPRATRDSKALGKAGRVNLFVGHSSHRQCLS